MSKFAYYNSTSGEILGLYDNSITNNIPVPNIPITDAQWLSISSQTSDMFLVDVATDQIINNPNPIIQNYIDTQTCVINGQFDELTNNSTLATSINYVIPVDRITLQNLQSAQTFMQNSGMQTLPFQLADGSIVTLTLAEIGTIINEIIQYGLESYQKLWAAQQNINNATSILDIMSVTLT